MKFTIVTLLVTFTFSRNLPAKGADHFYRLFMNTPLQGVDFYQGENTSGGARFRPNIASLASFTGGYKDLYVGISIKGTTEGQAKGKTSYTNYRASFNWEKFNFKAYYRAFRGLYLHEVKNGENSFYVFPNFKTKIFGINATYYFSRDYNRGIETTEFHTLMQELDGAKKKDSSWFLKIGYDENEIVEAPQGDPEFASEPVSDYIEMSEGKFKTILLTFGIDFYYIISNWLFDLKFGVGPGHQRQSFISRGEPIKKNELSSVFEIEFALGYNIGGFILSFQLESQRIESTLQFKRGFTSSGEIIGLSISNVF